MSGLFAASLYTNTNISKQKKTGLFDNGNAPISKL